MIFRKCNCENNSFNNTAVPICFNFSQSVLMVTITITAQIKTDCSSIKKKNVSVVVIQRKGGKSKTIVENFTSVLLCSLRSPPPMSTWKYWLAMKWFRSTTRSWWEWRFSCRLALFWGFCSSPFILLNQVGWSRANLIKKLQENPSGVTLVLKKIPESVRRTNPLRVSSTQVRMYQSLPSLTLLF